MNSPAELLHPNTRLKNLDIEWFKCLGRGHITSQFPNKWTMTLQDNGELQTNEEFDHDSTSSLEDDNEDLPCGEDL